MRKRSNFPRTIRTLFTRCVFQGAGHNDVELYNQYLERLKTFVAHELTNASKHLEEEANNETDDCYKTGVEAAWCEGKECVARWAEDGCWYRAVVDGVEGDTAVVTFTQYGNSDYCRLEDLRPADTELGQDGQLVVPEQDRETGDEDEEWS